MTVVAAQLTASARALPALLLIPAGPVWGRLLIGLLLAATAAPGLLAVAEPSSWSSAVAARDRGRERVFGLCAAVPLYAARAAGLLVSAAADPTSHHARILGRAAPLWLLATVAAVGGVGETMRVWLGSYALLPVTAMHGSLQPSLVALGGRVVVLGVTFALPIVGALALVDLVSRFVGAAEPRVARGLDALRPLLLALLVVVAIVRPAVTSRAIDMSAVLHSLR